jgi:hypothetical protein
MKKKTTETKARGEYQPFMVSEASANTPNVRRNIAGSIERTERFKNIEDGMVPFRTTSIYGANSSVDVRDAVILCQKCYYNFAIFRNVIDLMTEFSVNNIFYRGGSEKSCRFFEALFDKINIWDVQDRFFREYYRSGNVFVYRFDSKVKPEDIKNITKVFGAAGLNVEPMMVPANYTILNPAEIHMTGTANFAFGYYHKMLTEFEVARLKLPKTEEDVQIFNSLPEQAQKEIKQGNKNVMIPLDPNKIAMVFYKKQDYEPFAVPMGYPVLESINAKEEMKKIDMAIARTMQQIILLVTTGNEPDKHDINPKNLEAFRQLFANQSVGRVLVADYTTKAEFVIPNIGDLLTPEKYEVLERDINVGLNNIFASDEKFANQAQKVEIFVARLQQGRQAFLNNFLIPEIKRIAQSVGLKNYPTPYFEDIELKDNTNYAKIYARLMELGLLTPEQGFKAIETNTLPDYRTMEEEHKAYKDQRDKGLFEPLIGGKKEGEAGAPGGAAVGPKKVSPMGSKASEDKFGIKKVKEHMILAQSLEEQIVDLVKRKDKIKRLNKTQKEAVAQLTNLIIANEEPENWVKSINSYVENPEDRNKERVNKVIEIAASHQVDPYLAGILLASKMNE